MDNKVEYTFQFDSNNGEDKILTSLNKIDATLDNISKTNADDTLKKVSTEVSKTIPSKSIYNTVNLAAITYAFSRITDAVKVFADASAGLSENINLTTVAFYDNTKSLEENLNAVDDLANMYDNLNLNESEVLRSLGIFKQMANAMELPIETGNELAELMTKMSYDISSLYNIDLSQATGALESALVGQTKPIRGATGADITESTLEKTVAEVVPDRYIRDLSYVEKRLIMVISLTDQLKVSQGDFARTIESPANQMRILGEQIERVSIAIGNLLMPIIGNLLPYLNAFLMVIEVIISSLAKLVGFEQPSFDYSGISDSALELEEQLNSTGEAAEELKSGLRSFDKLNNITTPSLSDSGSGLDSGIDPRILEEFEKASQEYNDMMEGVETRASKISESILKFLGYTKDVNGEWELTEITIGGVATAIGAVLLTVLSIKKALGVIMGINSLLSFGGAVTETKTLEMTLTGIGKSLSVFGGIALIIGGAIGLFISLSDVIKNNGDDWINLGKAILSTIAIIGGAVLLGATWPVVLALAIVAALAIATVYIVKYWEEVKVMFNQFINWLKNNWGVLLIGTLLGPFSVVFYYIYAKFDEFKEFIDTYLENIKNTFSPIVSFFSNLFINVFNVVKTVFINVYEVISGIVGAIINVVSKVAEIFLTIGQVIFAVLTYVGTLFYDNIGKPIIDSLMIAWDWINNYFITPVFNAFSWLFEKISGLFISIADFVTDVFKAALNGLFTGIENIINFFIKGINGVVDVVNTLPGVDIGKVEELHIKRFADGGMPATGQLFIANESGPEVVSTLGGKSVVANMEQMMGYLDRRIDTKLGNNNGGNQNFTFQFGTREIATYTLNELKAMAKDNGQPITIG